MIGRYIKTLICLVLAFTILAVPTVKAIDQEDLSSINNDTVWYKAGAGSGACTVTVDSTLNGNDNIQKAFNYFISKGLTANQSAGIVGNMMWESGVNPLKIQGGGESQDPNAAGSGGWGIVQFTPANTKVEGIILAAKITTPAYLLGTQLDMVWAQLTGKAGGYNEVQAGNDIKSTSTVEDAVRAFQGDINIGGKYTGYERPKDEQATLSDRIDDANQVLQKYGGSAGGTVSAPAGSSDCSSTSGPGADTQYVDGFTIYSQYDPQWANDPYGSSTIAESGCGPSAMAMIITALTGKQVTPDITAKYAGSKGLYIPGAGSSWSIAPVLANHWGLNSTAIGANIAKITATLQSGGLVIGSGQGPLPFTTGGHYIVIRGVTAEGKWKIGDSAHKETNTQAWDPQQLISYMNDGSIYAISK